MNRLQKMAWSVVIMTLLGLILSAIAVAILYTRVGMPKAIAGFSCMGIVGLAGFSPLIFRKDKGAFDERDRAIKRRAALAGFAMSYLFVGLACMIPFEILGPKGVISVHWLPDIFAGSFLTSAFVWSAAILVQYGWGGIDGEK